MTARRKPVTVESVRVNTVCLALHVVAVVLVLNGHPGWGLYCFAAGWTVYAGGLCQEYLNREYPNEEAL